MKNFLIRVTTIILTSLLIWSFIIEPNIIITNKITIKNEQLKGVRIAIVGDFHLKKHDENKLKRIVKKINSNNPDIILLAGDYAHGMYETQTLNLKKISQNLKNLQSKAGIYAVLGNHDIWLDEHKMNRTLINAGINVLNNENKEIKINNETFTLAGTNDYTEGKADIAKALYNAKEPIILLTHNPDIFPFVPENVFLTISGHTHGGQVNLPFIGAVIVPSDYGKKYAQGLINDNNKKIFVTKGIGTTILPIRFNCFPEIVILNFE